MREMYSMDRQTILIDPALRIKALPALPRDVALQTVPDAPLSAITPHLIITQLRGVYTHRDAEEMPELGHVVVGYFKKYHNLRGLDVVDDHTEGVGAVRSVYTWYNVSFGWPRVSQVVRRSVDAKKTEYWEFLDGTRVPEPQLRFARQYPHSSDSLNITRIPTPDTDYDASIAYLVHIMYTTLAMLKNVEVDLGKHTAVYHPMAGGQIVLPLLYDTADRIVTDSFFRR